MLYFLYKHRDDRRPSVSHHMAISNKTSTVYALGHFVGGMAYLYFAYRYFYLDKNSTSLFMLSILGVIAEQAQAFFPNRAPFTKIHTVSAVAMGLLITTIVLSAPIVIDLASTWLYVYISIVGVLFGVGAYTLFNKPKFYRAQMCFFTSFHIFLLILLYGVE